MSGAPVQEKPALQRGLDRVAVLFYVTGALGIVTLMAITVVGVVWRYVLNDPIFGLQDLSSMTAAVVAASAVVVGAVSNAHITVNIMPKHFGRKVRRITDIVARGLGAGVLILAASSLIKKGGCGLACGNITSNLGIPHGPFYYGLATALGFIAIYLIIQIYAGVLNWQGEDPNEAVE